MELSVSCLKNLFSKITRSEKISCIFCKKQVFLIFWEMELSSSKIKKILIFSQKNFFLYFGKWNIFIKLLIFHKGIF